jgi:hypothetical protein
MLEIKFSSPADRRRFGLSLLVSVVIMAVGLCWSMQVGLRANITDHALYHENEHLQMLQHHQTEGSITVIDPAVKVQPTGGQK